MSDGTGYRRWLDKALVGSLAVLVTLIGIVYGLTVSALNTDVKATNGRVEKVERRADDHDVTDRQQGEAIKVLEIHRENGEKRQRFVDEWMQKIDDRTRDTQRDVTRILERLPEKK